MTGKSSSMSSSSELPTVDGAVTGVSPNVAGLIATIACRRADICVHDADSLQTSKLFTEY